MKSLGFLTGTFEKEQLMAKHPSETARRLAEDARRAAQMAADAGKEGAEAVQRTAGGAQDGLAQSGAVIADGMQSISREMMDLTQRSLEKSLSRFGRLAQCRTPQDFFATQNEIFRENLEEFLNSARRITEMSMRMSEGAAKTVGAIPASVGGEVVPFRQR